MIKSFPKIFTVGVRYIKDIFDDEVEITEKIDGSQFAFSKINGEVCIRSKGAQLYFDNPQDMFVPAINYVKSIADKLPENLVFYAEYLKKPKHNTLKYNRIPKNHLILFAVKDSSDEFFTNLEYYADLLDIESVPVIFKGKISGYDELKKMIDKESILGGVNIEGVVVKNYKKSFLMGDRVFPVMAGKYVSEKFKEVHNKRWDKEEKSKSRLIQYFESFKTDARWEKAVQHLKEQNVLENQPRDIGLLLKEIHNDITDEEKENVKEWLWREFSGQLKRTATAGFPEWYKEKLAKTSFEEQETQIRNN